MVQNGKFSDGMPIFVSTLKSVDLPTFGKPTIPICESRQSQCKQGRIRYDIRVAVAECRHATSAVQA